MQWKPNLYFYTVVECSASLLLLCQYVSDSSLIVCLCVCACGAFYPSQLYILTLPTVGPFYFLIFLQKWCSLLTRHFSNCKFQKIPQLFWRTRRKWHCDNCSLRISDFKAPGSISTTPYSGKETLYNVDIEFVFQTTVSENLEAATYCMLLFLKTSYETA